MLIQFMIAKKHKDVEYFVYFKRQIIAPVIPIIPLKNKLLDKRGLANPKTKNENEINF